MNIEKRRKIAFAVAMGAVTTGIISFVILAINLGLSTGFVAVWLRSWATGYAIVVPAILLIGPRVQARVNQLIS